MGFGRKNIHHDTCPLVVSDSSRDRLSRLLRHPCPRVDGSPTGCSGSRYREVPRNACSEKTFRRTATFFARLVFVDRFVEVDTSRHTGHVWKLHSFVGAMVDMFCQHLFHAVITLHPRIFADNRSPIFIVI